MCMFSKVKSVVKTPDKFFTSAKKSHDVKAAAKYLFLLLSAGSLLNIISAVLIKPRWDWVLSNIWKYEYKTPPQFNLMEVVFAYPRIVLIGFLVSLLWTLLLHFWIKLWRGKASLKETFVIYAYALTPTALLEWLPLVGLVAWFYNLYLVSIGIMKFHEIPKKRAFAIIFVPIVLFIVLTIGLSIYAFNNPSIFNQNQ